MGSGNKLPTSEYCCPTINRKIWRNLGTWEVKGFRKYHSYICHFSMLITSNWEHLRNSKWKEGLSQKFPDLTKGKPSKYRWKGNHHLKPQAQDATKLQSPGSSFQSNFVELLCIYTQLKRFFLLLMCLLSSLFQWLSYRSFCRLNDRNFRG